MGGGGTHTPPPPHSFPCQKPEDALTCNPTEEQDVVGHRHGHSFFYLTFIMGLLGTRNRELS